MPSFDYVDVLEGVRVDDIVVETDFTAVCPLTVPSSPYVGTVTVQYVPEQRLAELTSFAEWVRGPHERIVEDLTTLLRDEFVEIVKPRFATVTVTTVPVGHVAITCRASGGSYATQE